MLTAAIALAQAAQAATVRSAAVEATALDVRITVRFDEAFAGGVSKLRGAQFAKDKARLVIDLSEAMTLDDAEAEGDTLVLTLRSSGDKAFAAAVAKGRTKLTGVTVVAEAKLAETKPDPVQTAKVAEPKPASVQVAARPVETPAPKLPLKAPEPQVAVRPIEKTALAVQAAKALEKPATVAKPEPKREVTAAASTPVRPAAPRQRRGLPLVVVDAGHGGHDVGAISVYESRREKDVTLSIAKAIAREIEGSGRARVLLTRRDDRFLPLGQRVAIARAAKASLFISVHADSAPVPEARGATIYTLSEVASDREAARMAARENRSDFLLAGMSFAGSADVADILFDLTQRETMNASAEFANVMQREMQPYVRFKSNAHRFAGFRVLKAPDMPSVLLETGYLSNLEDSKFVFSEAGQKAIAKGVAKAVDAHLNRRIASR
jgi:N-acetylmuramoyl-L-alanine amidase